MEESTSRPDPEGRSDDGGGLERGAALVGARPCDEVRRLRREVRRLRRDRDRWRAVAADVLGGARAILAWIESYWMHKRPRAPDPEVAEQTDIALQLRAAGHTLRQIAESLDIQTDTLKKRLRRRKRGENGGGDK